MSTTEPDSKVQFDQDNYCIISNPFAGGRSKKRLLQSIEDAFGAENCLFLYTSGDGQAKDAIQSGRAAGLSRFIAVGGDGTILAIAPYLNPDQETLGLIAAGSGNGFASYFGYRRNVHQNLAILKRNRIKSVDTLKVNGQPFVNLAGVGFDAHVAAEVRSSQRRGFQAYFRAVLKLLAGSIFWKGKVIADGKEIHGEFLTVVVANAAIFGYGFHIARRALADDGLLTVVVVRRVSLWRYLFAIPFFLIGTTYRFSWMTEMTAKEASIHPDVTTLLQADGELFPSASSYTFQIEPRSLSLIIA